MYSLFNKKRHYFSNLIIGLFISLFMISSCEHEIPVENQTDTTPTASVRNLNATAGDKTVYLSWTNPSDSDFYGTRITFTPSVYGVSQPVVIEGEYSENSSTVFNGLRNGIEYTFTFVALDKNQNKSKSVSIKATPKETVDTTPPKEVSELKAAVSDQAITLTWKNPNDSDFMSTQITFTPRIDGVTQPITVEGKSSQTSTTTIDGLEYDTEYTFTLKTIDKKQNQSQGVQIKATPTDTTPPGEVINLVASPYHKRITLSWTNPSDLDFYGTEITYISSEGILSNTTIIQGAPSEQESFTITNLENNTNYKIFIKTVDNKNNKSQGIRTNLSPCESTLSLEAKLTNDNNEIIKLTNDIALIELNISSSNQILKAVWKKGNNNSYPTASELLNDVTATAIPIDSNPILLTVTENGVYDIAAQNSDGIQECIRTEIKTIDKTPLSEVEELHAECDGQSIYVTWKDPVPLDIYDSPLNKIIISYIYNDDNSDLFNNELQIEAGICAASIKIPYEKKNNDYLRITARTIDKLGNISHGDNTQIYCKGELIVTKDDINNKIENMSRNGKIYVYGDCDINTVKTALLNLNKLNENIKVELDLSKTTGVTSLEDDAFSSCNNIINLVLPDNISNIGNRAFKGCASLETIYIPQKVKYIGQQAFEDCTTLTGVTIPENVTNIEMGTFRNCTSLKKITIPENTLTLSPSAFNGCINLKNITIPGRFFYKILQDATWPITDITITSDTSDHEPNWKHGRTEEYVTNISITEGVLNIGACSFAYFTGLQKVFIPNSLRNIGDGAFMACVNLTSITIPNEVTNIGSSVFEGCTSLTNINISCNANISDEMFKGCKSLSEINIPEGITFIGNRAFEECTNLKTITLPSSCSNIGVYAFKNCTALETIFIPNGDKNLYGVFEGCTKLSNVRLPETLIEIGKDTFKNCVSLNTLDIPDSVTTFGEAAFYNCSSLTKINIPANIQDIPPKRTNDGYVNYNFSFYGCTNITNITIPGTELGKEIAKYFSNISELSISTDIKTTYGDEINNFWKKLTTLNILSGVKSRISNAFTECTNISMLSIPGTDLGKEVIRYFPNITKLTITSNIETQFNTSFAKCEKLTNVIISNGVTTIGDYAFHDSDTLKHITLPSSVINIGSNAFSRCINLTSINIPFSVESIGDYAFELCTSLKRIEIPYTTTLGKSVFYRCPDLKVIYVTHN